MPGQAGKAAGRTSVTLKMAANSVSQINSPQHTSLPKPLARDSLTPNARESITKLQDLQNSVNRTPVKPQALLPSVDNTSKSDDNKIGTTFAQLTTIFLNIS